MTTQSKSIKYLKFNELDSTQAWAHAHPEAWNVSGWTAITADIQRHGRGSAGSVWTDIPHSSLLMTLVSPPLEWSSAYVFVRHAQASLVVAEWLQSKGYAVELKWPNDIYLGTQKLGGFLTEAYWQQQVCSRWFLGLGMNVLAAPKGCARLDGLPLEGLAETLAEALVDALSNPAGSDILDRYTRQLIGFRQPCRFRDRNTESSFSATPRFISPDGRLGIQLESGSVRWVGHKELEWLDLGA